MDDDIFDAHKMDKPFFWGCKTGEGFCIFGIGDISKHRDDGNAKHYLFAAIRIIRVCILRFKLVGRNYETGSSSNTNMVNRRPPCSVDNDDTTYALRYGYRSYNCPFDHDSRRVNISRSYDHEHSSRECEM